MKIKNTCLSIILILTAISLVNCSKIPTEKIYKKSESEIPQTKKEKPQIKKEIPRKAESSNTIVLNTTEDKALDATLFAVNWIKWKIFIDNYDNGIIQLKEAYVYSDNGKLKRIYHWPPKESLGQSNISGYLNNIAIPDSNISFNDVAFTQENMKIIFSKTKDNQIRITVDYIFIPYMNNLKLGTMLNSSYYIEEILFSRIREYLESN